MTLGLDILSNMELDFILHFLSFFHQKCCHQFMESHVTLLYPIAGCCAQRPTTPPPVIRATWSQQLRLLLHTLYMLRFVSLLCHLLHWLHTQTCDKETPRAYLLPTFDAVFNNSLRKNCFPLYLIGALLLLCKRKYKKMQIPSMPFLAHHVSENILESWDEIGTESRLLSSFHGQIISTVLHKVMK